MKSSSTEKLIRKHVFANAYRHGGKANLDAVISKIVAEKPELRPNIKELIPKARLIISEINNIIPTQQEKYITEEFPELLERPVKRVEEPLLPDLPNAEDGKVVTRFPPEPNGYPHIGHAKAAVIDETYARQYKGRMILRFDDTNPKKEKLEYYVAIRDGLNWLGITPDLEKKSSDDMEIYYKYAEQIISDDRAYVCICKAKVFKQYRYEGRNCSCRSLTVKENLRRWNNMFKVYRTNEAVLRLKGDMKNVNTTLRDPTLFRIIDVKHPFTGDKYRVWPTYDFVAPIEDSRDGVTHALRTKEYELRNELYFLILDILQLRRPEMIEFSRLEIRGTTVSKRSLQPLVREELVEGWSDPRLPTLAGLRRRGFAPEAIRKFVLSLGVSKSESAPDWSLLESINRKLQDSKIKRFFFVPDPIKLEVKNAPITKAILKYHPEKDFGEREVETRGIFYIPRSDAVRLKDGDSIRLLGLYNVKIDCPRSSNIIGAYIGDKLKEGIPKIQWVNDKYIEFTVMIPAQLIVNGLFNKESLKVVKGFAEEDCKNLKHDDIIQFMRFGFCRVDSSKVAILTHK